MTELSETAQFFLLVEFGKTITHYFLVETKTSEYRIFGPVEIPSQFFRKTQHPDLLFKQGIHQLEMLSGRKLMSSGILVISPEKAKTRGVNAAIVVGGQDFKNDIELLKAVPLYSSEECHEAAFTHFFELNHATHFIDIGSASSHYYYQNEKVPKQNTSTLGMGEHALYLLRDECGPDNVMRWLPFEMEIILLENYIANKSVTPHVVPFSQQDSMIEAALQREVLRLSKPEDFFMSEKLTKVVVSGAALSHIPSLNHIAMILADGVEPEGICEIYLDKNQILKCFGGLIKADPEVIKDIDTKSLFPHLVSIITLSGTFEDKEELGTTLVNFGFEEVQEIRLQGGGLYYIPTSGQSIELELQLSPKAHIKGVEVTDRQKGLYTLKLDSGERGFILDARGRPLICPRPSAEGRRTLINWLNALSIDDLSVHEG